MNTDPSSLKAQSAPQWLRDMDRELMRGRQVLLYGNVSDEFQVDPEKDDYVSLADYLQRHFTTDGFQVVGQYDSVDHFTWADATRMEPLVRQILTGRGPVPDAEGESRSTASPTAEPERASPGLSLTAAPNRQRMVGLGSGAPADERDRSLDSSLRLVRTLVRNTHFGVAILIRFSDRLVGDPEHQTNQELPGLILIRKLIEEAGVLNSGVLRLRRNCCVLVADRLEGVPAWLYQENPLLALIPVSRPNVEDRARFVRRTLPQFHGYADSPPSAEHREQIIREFANLTEGLTSRDLRALVRTSVIEKLPTTQMKKLVDRFRYGQVDDPWLKLDAKFIRSAPAELEKSVIGQSGAIKAVVEMLVAARVGLSLSPGSRSSKPKGVFFFVGPTGVGKTELAKALTKEIFGDPAAYSRFDMSEYNLEHASEKLTGSPPGYVGYGQGGQLTNRLIERPFSLLLFDEIEKSHPKIMDKFLQVLDEGRLTDSRGQTADFSQSVIIFTSNIGSGAVMSRLEKSVGTGAASWPEPAEIRDHYLREVSRHFSAPPPEGLGRPELLNRLGDNVLVFDILREEYIVRIASKFIENLQRSSQELGIALQFNGDEVPQMVRAVMMADPQNLRMGGRQVRTLTEKCVLKPISNYIFEHGVIRGEALSVRADSGSNSVRIERAS